MWRENAVNKAAFGDWIFDEIKQKETQFLPHLLSKALIESDLWGAVRVLPEADPSLVLTIRGEIISSTGLDLAVHINATDSSGRVWLARDYADVAQLSDYPESTRFTYGNHFDGANYVDPFHDLYKQVANDLLAARDGLDDGLLAETLQIADLVYARDLAPERFASTLTEDKGVPSMPADGGAAEGGADSGMARELELSEPSAPTADVAAGAFGSTTTSESGSAQPSLTG